MKTYLELLQENCNLHEEDIIMYGCICDFNTETKINMRELCEYNYSKYLCYTCWHKKVIYPINQIEIDNVIECIKNLRDCRGRKQ